MNGWAKWRPKWKSETECGVRPSVPGKSGAQENAKAAHNSAWRVLREKKERGGICCVHNVSVKWAQRQKVKIHIGVEFWACPVVYYERVLEGKTRTKGQVSAGRLGHWRG